MLPMSVLSNHPFATIHMQALKQGHIPLQRHVNAAFHFAIAGKLTSVVGKALAGFPVEPWMGKVLLAGAELGCAQEALIVVAMAATDPIWLTPRLLPLLCLLPCPFPCPYFALSLAYPLGIAPFLALARALVVRHSASWMTCMTCDLACSVLTMPVS